MKRLTILLLLLTVVGGLAAQTDERDDLVLGNNTFAFNLYHELRTQNQDNLIFSPYSISQAFGMTYAGARGTTEQQMQTVLDFRLPQEQLHPEFKDLTDSFVSETTSDSEKTPFQLNIVNALWGQNDFAFDQTFLEMVNDNYGGGLELLDFSADPETARQTINEWVAEQTAQKILDLLPEGSITDLTRLVLTNAIYFNASWAHLFDPADTEDAPFTLLDGSTVTVPFMNQTTFFRFLTGENYRAVSLPYHGGNIEMLVILPVEGQFEAFESALNEAVYTEIRLGLRDVGNIDVYLPRFQITSDVKLNEPLIQMGMSDAFDPDTADFSGMVAESVAGNLYISNAFHKAFIEVDEAGTEAAAATAVVVGVTSAPSDMPAHFRADRPFLYIIYDRETGSILFMGRVMNPAD